MPFVVDSRYKYVLERPGKEYEVNKTIGLFRLDDGTFTGIYGKVVKVNAGGKLQVGKKYIKWLNKPRHHSHIDDGQECTVQHVNDNVGTVDVGHVIPLPEQPESLAEIRLEHIWVEEDIYETKTFALDEKDVAGQPKKPQGIFWSGTGGRLKSIVVRGLFRFQHMTYEHDELSEADKKRPINIDGVQVKVPRSYFARSSAKLNDAQRALMDKQVATLYTRLHLAFGNLPVAVDADGNLSFEQDGDVFERFGEMMDADDVWDGAVFQRAEHEETVLGILITGQMTCTDAVSLFRAENNRKLNTGGFNGMADVVTASMKVAELTSRVFDHVKAKAGKVKPAATDGEREQRKAANRAKAAALHEAKNKAFREVPILKRKLAEMEATIRDHEVQAESLTQVFDPAFIQDKIPAHHRPGFKMGMRKLALQLSLNKQPIPDWFQQFNIGDDRGDGGGDGSGSASGSAQGGLAGCALSGLGRKK